jgi:hypothetical protein
LVFHRAAELLSHFHPVVAGAGSGAIIVGLVALPYLDWNPAAMRLRKVAVWFAIFLVAWWPA